MYHCDVYCAICIILTCEVYPYDLHVLDIWDFESTAGSRQAKKGRAKASPQCEKPSDVSQAMWLKGM
jgi:hypothetical protein